MFGQMTAGSWIYIGTQGILQGTYQTFAAAGETHFGSPDLAGRTILTAGLGGMGGAQPLAATMAGAAILCVEVDPTRIERRLETRYLDEASRSLDDALARVRARRPRARAVGRAARERRGRRPGAGAARRALRPRHRPDGGARSADRLRPAGSVDEAAALRAVRSGRVPATGPCVDRAHMCAAARVRPRTAAMFSIMATTCEGRPMTAGVDGGLLIPGLRPGLYPAALLPRHRPVPLGCALGRPGRHRRDRRELARALPGRRAPAAVARACARAGGVPGPAGADLLARLRRRARRRASRSTSSCARATCSAPVVIGRDHLDSGSVASPYRETEAMQDGSDAIADWPILNALLNTAAGATWVSVHHGGGVGIGNSIHAGMVVVADGSDEAADAARAGADGRSRHGRDAARRRGLRGRGRSGRGGARLESPCRRRTREPAPACSSATSSSS